MTSGEGRLSSGRKEGNSDEERISRNIIMAFFGVGCFE